MALLTCLFSHKKSAKDKEIKPGIQSWLPEMLITKSLVASAIWSHLCSKGHIDLVWREGVKCLFQRKWKVSSRVWGFIYLFI